MSGSLLILGGTSFLGRALTERAMELGFAVTLFNRGVTNPGLFPEVELLKGDRAGDLSALAGRRWDVVIDAAAHQPEVVERSLAALAPSVDLYAFISSIAVCASWKTVEGLLEDAPVITAEQAAGDLHAQYGADKARCESLVVQAMGAGRSLIVRPGMIVGAHDPTDRFGHWPRRMAQGGRVLAPGKPNDPVQFIDVKDLADWALRAVGRRLNGVFNVTGLSMPFGDFLEACRVADVDSEIVWVDRERLMEAGVTVLPMWVGLPDLEAACRVNVDRALGQGLRFRPLSETIADARLPPAARPAFPAVQEQALLDRIFPSS